MTNVVDRLCSIIGYIVYSIVDEPQHQVPCTMCQVTAPVTGTMYCVLSAHIWY